MTSQVHEDVDPITANEVRHFVVRQPHNVPPRRNVFSEPLGELIFQRDICVAEYLDSRAIVGCQQTIEEIRHRMIPKVR